MRDDVQDLINSAEEDLNAAKLLLNNHFLNSAAFHAQQATEKILKSFLLFKNNSYPFTHSIKLLLDKCTMINHNFTEIHEAFLLDQYYTQTRYLPMLKINFDDVKEAIEIAEKVINFVLNMFEKEK